MKHILKKIYSVFQFPCFMERGVSLLLVVLIMSVILAIGAGISTILIQELRMTGEMGHSVVAFYAADSGIEQQLYNLYKMSTTTHRAQHSDNLAENLSYIVNAECSTEENCYINEVNADCPALNYCIKSIGSYGKTKRGIEVNY